MRMMLVVVGLQEEGNYFSCCIAGKGFQSAKSWLPSTVAVTTTWFVVNRCEPGGYCKFRHDCRG